MARTRAPIRRAAIAVGAKPILLERPFRAGVGAMQARNQ